MKTTSVYLRKGISSMRWTEWYEFRKITINKDLISVIVIVIVVALVALKLFDVI